MNSSDAFVITSFQRGPKVDDAYAEKTWDVLKSAIREINKRRTSNLSYEELYRFAYNMVLHKHGAHLYRGLSDLLAEHLREVAEQVRAAEPDNFLQEVRTQWAWFELSLGHVRDVLMYMDRTYLRPRNKKSVNDLGVSLFCDIVVRDPSIMPRLVDAVLQRIDAERSGETIDGQLIRAITRMLAELGTDDDGSSVYVSIFENEFLDRTRAFYAREAQLFLAESTCSEYLRKALARIREEKQRVESYLEGQTEAKVVHVAEVELISKYMKTLVEMENSGLVWMLRNDKVYDLRLMHTLFRNVADGDEILRTNLRNEVMQRGNALVREAQQSMNHHALITAVLKLKEKYDGILQISFCTPTSIHAADMFESVPQMHSSGGPSSSGGPARRESTASSASGGNRNARPEPDKKYVNTINVAFERFLNSFQQSAEYLSLYVDKLIKRDVKGSTDDEIEARLDAVMTLFRYLHEKDVFEKYYKVHLTRRLLDRNATSIDVERSFISKMKNECGYLYTSKMEVMFNDMKISSESTEQFERHVSAEGIDMSGVELRVSILTTMSWPITAQPVVTLPSAAANAIARFEQYYLAKHNGRVLTWQRSMGNGEVVSRFGNGARTYDLIVPAHAMCVLMLYNDANSLTFREVQAATKIPADELRRVLQSLALGKSRVLSKSPPTKEVADDDKFAYNDGFTSKSRRVKIAMIAPPREPVQSAMRARIYDDRKPLIEAAIVRVMKAGKIMEYNKLICEVTKQLLSRFRPDPPEIKRRIESLVDREFLERKEGQRQVYQYVA